MSVDVVEDLVVVFKGATPSDITALDLEQDVAEAVAEVMALAEEEVARLATGIRVGTATGLFLELHAKEHGVRKQSGETDDQLRERISKPQSAVTPKSIRKAIQAVIGGSPDDVILLECPRDAAYFDRMSFFSREMLPTVGNLIGAGRGIVIALIPASAGAFASVVDALRSKIAAGKIPVTLEYT